MKKLLMLLVAGTMVFAVSGCGQKSTADKAKDTSTSAKNDAGKAVDSAKKDAGKAVDSAKKDMNKALDDLKK